MKKALAGLVTILAVAGGYYHHEVAAEAESTPFARCVQQILLDQGGPVGLNGLAMTVKRQYRLDLPTAEDVVHDTLLSVCLKEGVKDVRPYFQQALRNAAVDARRLGSRCPVHAFGPNDECYLIQHSDPRLSECTELRRKVETVFCQLPYDYQQWIRWHAFEQLDFNEIAKRMGVTPKTARSQIEKAITLLRIKMGIV